MPLNCEALTRIERNCGNALGGIDQRIWINDSVNVDFDSATIAAHVITNLDNVSTATGFEVIEFRKNLASLSEAYTSAPDGAVLFTQTLTLPIHGRDASKSKKISVMAAGQRELDIIVPQNDGGYVYLRKAMLQTVADGTGAAKADGSKYTLTFTGESEELSYFITYDAILNVLEPIV